MSVIASMDGLESKSKQEQKEQIVKYVKSVWPKYDAN